MHKDKSDLKKKIKARVRKRIRSKMRGTADRPRVFVFKTNRYVYVQAINDETGTVLAAACTLEKGFKEKNKNTKNKDACQALGQIMAERLKVKMVETIIFDRGLYPYHGRIKLLAEALRKGGLVF